MSPLSSSSSLLLLLPLVFLLSQLPAPAQATVASECAAGSDSGGSVNTDPECLSHTVFQDFAGSSATPCCAQCVAGKYKSVDDAAGAPVDCASCPGGYAPNALTGATECTECTPGKFAASGAATCAACDMFSYTSSARSSFCYPCPVYGRPTDDRTGCACVVGYYMVKGDCLPCPYNVNCSSTGTVASTATCSSGNRYYDSSSDVLTCASALFRASRLTVAGLDLPPTALAMLAALLLALYHAAA